MTLPRQLGEMAAKRVIAEMDISKEPLTTKIKLQSFSTPGRANGKTAGVLRSRRELRSKTSLQHSPALVFFKSIWDLRASGDLDNFR